MLTSGAPAVASRPAWREHLAVLVVAALVVSPVVAHAVDRTLAEATRELVVVATLKALHLEHVLERHRASAGLSGTSFPQAGLYEAWQEGSDLVARDRLFLRLHQFASAGGFPGVVLLDPSLRLLWSATGGGADVGAHVAQAWPEGAPPGSQALVGFDDAAAGGPTLGFAVTLPTESSAPAPVVVYLLPIGAVAARDIGGWAFGMPCARMSLFAAAPDGLRGVATSCDDLARAPEPWTLPWARADAVQVRLSLGDVGPLHGTVGTDDRGVEVLAAGRALGDAGWFLLVQRDRGALWAGMSSAVALGIVVAALLAVIGIAAWTFQRSRQREAAARGAAKGLQLLQAVTDASPDAVIAKDRQGRYLLFNRAAEAYTGQRAAEVLGRDARALFPPAEAAAMMQRDRAAMREERIVTEEELITTVQGERVFLTTRGPLRDEDGRVVGAFDISRDVTDRAAAEEALRVDRERLAASLEELRRFNDALVDRELAMVELKRRLSAALRELGRPEPFDLVALDATGDGDA